MINLTLHEELLAESRASSHCRTTPQLLQAKAPCTQQPAFLAMASVAASMPPPLFDYLSYVAPSCLVSHSLPWAIRQCGSGRRRADVLSIPPARRQRHSTWPPCVLLTLVMGTAILSTISGLLTPVGNDWQVSIPETGLLQRSTTCARCPAPAEQMTKTRYYLHTTLELSTSPLLLG